MPYHYRKHERIRKNSDFISTMKGKRLSVDGLSLFYAPNAAGNFRVGVSISKKVGTAVTRNRLRRRLRDCIGRALQHRNDSYDLVFVVRQGISDNGFDRIRKAVEAILFKSSLRIQQSEGPQK